MTPNKPFAESCVQNRAPIFSVLEPFLHEASSVLEIGSGTGQHAVYIGCEFPHLSWQTSELVENHAGINAWLDDCGCSNIQAPLELDVDGEWPQQRYDVIFSANTLHIMSASSVENLFRGVSQCMHNETRLFFYGPFNYAGEYTSASNRDFDQWLKARDVDSGIKNFDWLCELGVQFGLECCDDIGMPANNRVLIWKLG